MMVRCSFTDQESSCVVGQTVLGYKLRAIDDVHAMLVERGEGLRGRFGMYMPWKRSGCARRMRVPVRSAIGSGAKGDLGAARQRRTAGGRPST